MTIIPHANLIISLLVITILLPLNMNLVLINTMIPLIAIENAIKNILNLTMMIKLLEIWSIEWIMREG